MNISTAVRHINRMGILLVFPQANKKEPPSLWYQFFPRTPMRWEWDENGDNRVGELWHLKERLSSSRKVIYSKWFRGKATVFSLPCFTALLRLANPDMDRITNLSSQAREILDLLDEDSPLSTKQLKRMSGLQGRASEALYQRALKELWERGLVVAFGEVDEGAFPSIAVGSTRILFEKIWSEAAAMSLNEAEKILAQLEERGSFAKFLAKLRKSWSDQSAETEADTGSPDRSDDQSDDRSSDQSE